MHPAPIAGYRVVMSNLASPDLYARPCPGKEFDFDLDYAAPDPMPLERALSLFQRCVEWSVTKANWNGKYLVERYKVRTREAGRVPYFKFRLLAIDAQGDIAFGWLPFAVATPDGEPGAAGLPIHEYGGQFFLAETPEWYRAYAESVAHVVGSFEEKEREVRQVMARKRKERRL